MPDSPSRKPNLRSSRPGLRLTDRDLELLLSVYELRQASRPQLQRLHFSENATPAKVASRRLKRLTTHGYLRATRCPTLASAGPPGLVYCTAPYAVPFIAHRHDLPLPDVKRRQRQDMRLGPMFFQHRAWITDIHIDLLLACRRQGYSLTFQSDESLARAKLSVTVEGTKMPVRPDAFIVIARLDGTSRAAFFLELQQASKPAHYQRKAQAYMAFKATGAYTKVFGYQSLRVLAVAESEAKARHLQEAAHHVGGSTLFWSAALPDVLANPLTAPIWFVAGETDRMPLLT